MDLTNYRQQIDIIDEQILQLFEKRMNTAKKIAGYKQAHHLPIFNLEREQEILQHIARHVRPDLSESAVHLYELLFSVSRTYQKQQINNSKTVSLFSQIKAAPSSLVQNASSACLGLPGGEAVQAAKKFLAFPRMCFFDTPEAVLEAVGKRTCCYGILPLTPLSICQIQDKHFYIIHSTYIESIEWVCVSHDLIILPEAGKSRFIFKPPYPPELIYRFMMLCSEKECSHFILEKSSSCDMEKHEFLSSILEFKIHSPIFEKYIMFLEEFNCPDNYLGSYPEV